MERIPELRLVGRESAIATATSRRTYMKDIEIGKPAKSQTLESLGNSHSWKGKKLLQEDEEFVPDVLSYKFSDDSFEECGSTSFHGVSHPLEPEDSDTLKPVYVPIEQSKGVGKCTVAPFLEDVSNHLPGPKKMVTPVEDPNRFSPISSPRKECIWDSSLPPSGNVSPYSSIDSSCVARSMSIANSSSASTSQSDVIMSDSMLIIDKNFEIRKGSSILGDSLESTKTSISQGSNSSAGVSDDSNWSSITGNKPHKGNDPRWKAILVVRARDGILGMSHFKLLRRLGCGDIGSVYLSELSGTNCFFAMKVMDKASLASRNKLNRSQTEREILQLLDHPFLPTLYTHFETDRFSCLVMEYCPGGDLHTLRQRQPGRHFSEYAAKFYAAEVLLALEYLHMLGVVYRDLKPENVLVRCDGHIMLSDFDLSLRCAVSPTLIRNSSSNQQGAAAFCVKPACVEPTSSCMQPTCFLPRILPPRSKNKAGKFKPENKSSTGILPELVAEPTSARSMSFVGTHEYLAPEIIKGEGHGSAVDWWTFGIFLHELLYGKTPFKGSGNRATLFNVVGQQLKFPESPATSYASRDLIRALLVKEPQNRLGVKRGAAEIKQHAFFEGVNWALIRCSTPPEVPRPVEADFSAKFRSVDLPGTGSKRAVPPVGSQPQPGGKFLDFEFF